MGPCYFLIAALLLGLFFSFAPCRKIPNEEAARPES